MFNISPKEDKFFDMFISCAETINRASVMLKDMIGDLSDCENMVVAIKDLEHECDYKSNQLLEELNKSFITPLDREDIYYITKKADDILDLVDAAACRFSMFNVKVATEEAKELGALIATCSEKLIVLLQELKIMKKSKCLPDVIASIYALEKEGDQIFRRGVKKIFSEDMEVLDVMKWREIYEYLEDTLDAYESLAKIIEGVVTKHA